MNLISEEEYARQLRKYAPERAVPIIIYFLCVVVGVVTAACQLMER